MTTRNENKTFTVTFLPFDTAIEVAPGTTILDAARAAGLPIKATCGGDGTCGECIVQVTSGKFRAKQSAALTQKLIEQGYTVACNTEVSDDLIVHLPRFEQLSIKSVADSTFFNEHRDELSGVYEIDPIIQQVTVRVPSPTIDDNFSDLMRIERELRRMLDGEDLGWEFPVLRILSRALREREGYIQAVLLKKKQSATIIDTRAESETVPYYGAACDIGTTTVALQLVDLTDGTILNTASSYNQQIKCGEDVISRINYAGKPGHLEELHALIITTINQLIERATGELDISRRRIYYISVAGNTTMTHLFLNLDPRYIREAPYVPTLNRAPHVAAHNLGLEIHPQGWVHCAPGVGSYVGGDITAGLLCTPILRDAEKISLFIDIGTNGELVIGNGEWLMTCACSAGPAFEGSGIKCGMPATDGAIEKIRLGDNGKPDYRVIGEGGPKGLCGSALIDLLAELFVHGFIDRSGKFNEERAAARIVEDGAGKAFLIEVGSKCFWERDLTITETDIANLIRTKGAIFSACSLLLKNVGLAHDRIDAVYIAGGFGRHLDIENAIRIGLFPDLDRQKFHYLGNSSLLGSYLILISDKNREIVNEIAAKMTYLELNTEPDYMNEYTGALFLPHTNLDFFPSVRELLNPPNP